VSGPVRILVVEDSHADVRLLREAVREHGLDVVLDTVADGELALRHLRGDGPRPDLILLDLNLPRLHGREVLESIKADPDLRSIPVIVLSTSASPRDVAECYERHASAYLVKPMGLDDLGELVLAIEAFWLRKALLPGAVVGL
jgi:chemotaxis family two-component system response regulator Rcp1